MRMQMTLIAVLLGSMALVPRPAHAGISSFNGTCPGGIDVHADEGGPVFVNGRETALRRFNDNYFEAKDAKSGTTLSISRAPDGSTQMSYTASSGAHGICNVGGAPTSDSEPGYDSRRSMGDPSSTEVTCESRDNKQAECAMDTRGEIQVARRLSRSRCDEGEDWGLNRHSVWVRNGCRAVFRNISKDDGRDRTWRSSTPADAGGDTADAAVAACKSALALKASVNPVFVLPVSHVPAAGGYEVFLSLNGKQWLCTTDSRGNVNRMDQR